MKSTLFFLVLFLFVISLKLPAVSSLDEARALFKQGKWDDAIALLQQQPEKGGQEWAYLGTLLALKGKEEEALPCYEKAAHLSPENPLYLNNMAVTYYGLSNEQKAKEWFLKVLQVAPKDQRALEFLQKIDAAQKANEVMLQQLEEKLKPKEETFAANVTTANQFLKLHKWALAQKYFEKANQLDSKSYEVKAALAQLAYRQQDLENAAAYWDEAQALQPTAVEPVLEAGRLYAALGRYSEAARCWESVNTLASAGSEEKKEAQYYLKSLAPFLSQKRAVP